MTTMGEVGHSDGPTGSAEPAAEEGKATVQSNGSSAVEVEHLKNGEGGRNFGKGLLPTSLWMGGTSVFDAWLIAGAAQIGQVILTLPYTLSQMGYAYGVIFLVLYGLLGAWSVYLLAWLYFEFKCRTALTGKVYPERHILQYHEVIGGLTGKWGKYVTYFFVIVALAIASVIQLIASASDLYYANSNLDKREWTYIVGAVAFLSVFIPSYGHFRTGAMLGLVTTTITSIYLVIAAISHGQAAGVKHTGANNKVDFFTGATNILFAFGGHGITIEIMETMKRPSKFKSVYLAVVFYTLLVTIPSSVSVYWAYGDVLLRRSNAFSVVPQSGWRTMAIASIVVHQGMGFVLFSHPVFLVCEKALGVHTKVFILRILVRIPVVAFLWFLALAVPFFGPINSVMGALLVSVGVYIIPLAAFFLTFRTKAARQNSALKLPRFLPSWYLIFLFNAIIMLWIVVIGIGFGGWASITNFVRQINTFGFFDRCFQC